MPPENVLSQKSSAAIEEWLVNHVAALLNAEPAEIDTNLAITSFGIESLMLFSLAGDLASWLGHDIEITLLWEYPTLAALAAHLGKENEAPKAPRKSLVAIQPNGSKAPFYVVHDLSGMVWCYVALSKYLGDQPLFGFQLSLGESEMPQIESLEELAVLYVAELRAHQPVGPYFLGGYSMGGTIAFEMAQLLRQQKQEIALLVLIDTPFSGLKRRTPSKFLELRFHARNLRHLDAAQKRRYLNEKLRDFLWFQARKLRRFKFVGRFSLSKKQRQKSVLVWAPPTAELPQLWVRHPLFDSVIRIQLQRAFDRYVPRPYGGRITMLRAQIRFSNDNDYGNWRRLALGGFKQHTVPGAHAIIVAEPYARHLAATLKRCLHESQTARNDKF